MLPVLLHRIANATQHLSGLAALLAVDPGALTTRGGDLAETSDRVDDTGWLLALLASAAGARLLLARRERQGLRPLVACVRECLRREGRDLAEPQGPLPELSPNVADGWQLPWAIGTLLHSAGGTLSPRQSLAWTVRVTRDGTRIECSAPSGMDWSAFELWLSRELPAATLRNEGGSVTLALPGGWLIDPEVTA